MLFDIFLIGIGTKANFLVRRVWKNRTVVCIGKSNPFCICKDHSTVSPMEVMMQSVWHIGTKIATRGTLHLAFVCVS